MDTVDCLLFIEALLVLRGLTVTVTLSLSPGPCLWPGFTSPLSAPLLFFLVSNWASCGSVCSFPFLTYSHGMDYRYFSVLFVPKIVSAFSLPAKEKVFIATS